MEEIETLVKRFADLYLQQRQDVLSTLDSLPEFTGMTELQSKTMLSVVVVSP